MKNQVARKSVLVASSNILITFFGLISTIFVKRYYGYEGIGMIAFASSYVAVFGIISDMGLGAAHTKIFNQRNLSEKVCNGTFLFLKSFANFAMIFAVLGSFFISDSLDIDNENTLSMIVLVLLSIRFITNYVNSFKSIFSAKLEVAKMVIPRILFRFILMVLKISACVIGLDLILVVGMELFTVILTLLTFLYFFKSSGFSRPKTSVIKEYISFALPITMVSAVIILSTNLDRLMLQYFIDTREVGVYFLPLILLRPLVLFSSSFDTVLFPVIARKLSNKDRTASNHISKLSVKYISLFTLPFITILIIFSETILVFLFGSDASDSSFAMKILCIGFYFASLRSPYKLHSFSIGKMKIIFLIACIPLLSNLILNYFLIPYNFDIFGVINTGSIGASIATTISYIILFILTVFYATNLTGIGIYTNLWKHMFASFTGIIIGHFISPFFTGLSLIVVGSVSVIILFYLVLFLLKEVNEKDLEIVLESLNPRKMGKYVKGEIYSR